MNGIDIGILVVIGISAAMGLVRGLMREVLSLAAWIAAFVMALALSGRLQVQFESYISDPSARFVAAFALIFIVTLILGGLVQWLVGKLVSSTGLTGMDRTLGLLFGGLRGAVLIIVVIVMLRPFSGTEPWWRHPS
ncbi:MAG: CvpA family protein [Gammaproteobacteria bacterium]|nr:CvpA family protein [Gammaproteobacteria bacterium]